MIPDPSPVLVTVASYLLAVELVLAVWLLHAARRGRSSQTEVAQARRQPEGVS